jgi:light-regulated signal transduction histidine kinase (bacteriophytochrome)
VSSRNLDELLLINTQLEQRLRERSAELAAAHAELDAFASSVSHDLRAPLRAIDGFSQALSEDYGPQLPDEARHYLKVIRDGAHRMGRLIDDLLEFSRLSRSPLTAGRVNTGKLVRAALAELSSEPHAAHVEVTQRDLPPCWGDPALLKRVWVNLISNAFKFSMKRDPAVIEVGSMMDAGRCVFFVRDNGAGFDMRYADQLFGVFQRLHRSDEYEGTGVGLAVVQRVVHRHGGHVWADAAVDRGATFYFDLAEETG